MLDEAKSGYRLCSYILGASAAALGGSADPAPFLITLSNFAYNFEQNADTELLYNWVIPCDYVAGSNINAFVIWTPASTGSGDVRWVLDAGIYTPEVDSVGNPSDIAVLDAAGGAANKVQRSPAFAISGASASPGDLFNIRLYRDADNAADTYGAFARYLGLEIQYYAST